MSNFMNPTNIIIIIVFCILLILYIISIYKDKKKAKAVYNKANKDNLVYLAIDNNTKVYSIDGLIPLI